MRVLVTGGGGQLATDVGSVCRRAGDEVTVAARQQLDISDRDAVLACLTALRPDVVINAAAWTAVDACEADPDRALAVNGLAVRWLAEGCARAGARLVQVSTDYVFDGMLDRPYHEWDTPNPQSVYGITKRIGETEAAVLGTDALVVRTSWVCSAHGNNMVRTVLRLAAEHPHLSFVDDQIGHPTFTSDLAVALRDVAVHRLSGTAHITNQGAVSWYQFAREVLLAAGADPDRIRPIPTSQLQPPRPAPRPANSVLDNAVLRVAGFPLLRDFREPLAESVSQLLERPPTRH
jgi:dTDP-4-dehydrorhamnose reductase